MARVKWVKVEGLRQIEEALMNLKRATAKNVALRALKKAAEPMAADMRARAPDDPTSAGWDLHTSINIATKATRGAKHRKLSPVEVLIGPRVRHQQLLEYGTRRMPPHPYVRPAWDAGKMQALEDIKTSMWEEIAEAAKRAARKEARASK